MCYKIYKSTEKDKADKRMNDGVITSGVCMCVSKILQLENQHLSLTELSNPKLVFNICNRVN